MAFVVKKIKTLKKNLTITIPQDFGDNEAADVDVEWKRLSRSEQQAITDREQAMIDCVVDIDGLKTEDGKDLKFTKKRFEDLLEEDYIFTAFMMQFNSMLYGDEFMKAFAEKNLSKPDAIG